MQNSCALFAQTNKRREGKIRREDYVDSFSNLCFSPQQLKISIFSKELLLIFAVWLFLVPSEIPAILSENVGLVNMGCPLQSSLLVLGCLSTTILVLIGICWQNGCNSLTNAGSTSGRFVTEAGFSVIKRCRWSDALLMSQNGKFPEIQNGFSTTLMGKITEAKVD